MRKNLATYPHWPDGGSHPLGGWAPLLLFNDQFYRPEIGHIIREFFSFGLGANTWPRRSRPTQWHDVVNVDFVAALDYLSGLNGGHYSLRYDST